MAPIYGPQNSSGQSAARLHSPQGVRSWPVFELHTQAWLPFPSGQQYWEGTQIQRTQIEPPSSRDAIGEPYALYEQTQSRIPNAPLSAVMENSASSRGASVHQNAASDDDDDAAAGTSRRTTQDDDAAMDDSETAPGANTPPVPTLKSKFKKSLRDFRAKPIATAARFLKSKFTNQQALGHPAAGRSVSVWGNSVAAGAISTGHGATTLVIQILLLSNRDHEPSGFAPGVYEHADIASGSSNTGSSLDQASMRQVYGGSGSRRFSPQMSDSPQSGPSRTASQILLHTGPHNDRASLRQQRGMSLGRISVPHSTIAPYWLVPQHLLVPLASHTDVTGAVNTGLDLPDAGTATGILAPAHAMEPEETPGAADRDRTSGSADNLGPYRHSRLLFHETVTREDIEQGERDLRQPEAAIPPAASPPAKLQRRYSDQS